MAWRTCCGAVVVTSLPEFDIRMKPTVRKEWLRLYPKRTDGAFWWRVGCVVRMRHIRHKDVEKIAAVCAAVDTEWPHVPWAKHNPKHDHNKLPAYPMWVGREKECDRMNEEVRDTLIDTNNVLMRLDRKVTNMRLEFKATNHSRKHDMDELHSLIEIVRKNVRRLAK